MGADCREAAPKSVLIQGLIFNIPEYSSALKQQHRDLLGIQWLRLCTSTAGGPGSIPGQGTNWIPRATTKTRRSQRNKLKKKKKKKQQYRDFSGSTVDKNLPANAGGLVGPLVW